MTSKLFVTYKFYICKMCLLSTKDQGKYNEIEDMIPSVNGFVFSEIGHYVEWSYVIFILKNHSVFF